MFITTFFFLPKQPLTGNSPGAHQEENGKTKYGLFTQQNTIQHYKERVAKDTIAWMNLKSII